MDLVVSAPVAKRRLRGRCRALLCLLARGQATARPPGPQAQARCRRLRGRRGDQAGRARCPLHLPAPPCPHALRPADRRAGQVRAHRAAGLRRGRDGAGPRADQRRGRGRGRAARRPTRTAARSTRASCSTSSWPIPCAACISATPCCCRARNRPRRWPSSCATASSISASPGSSARARRPSCCWPTSASSTPRTTSTQPATEIAADVCILDPQSQVAVLRGDVVPEGKYAGRRVFNAGINLTHLYYGKIPFLWFLIRDLGFVNKMMRGLGQARRAARRGRGQFDREALDLGGRDLRHRRRLPDPAGDRLQHRRRATPT